MAGAPILVKCPCGVETRGASRSVVTCSGCGARYDTAAQADAFDELAARTQRQFRYASRAGLGVVGLMGIAGLVLLNVPGLVGGAAIGAVAWFVVLMPLWKRRALRKASTLYTPTVAPTRK